MTRARDLANLGNNASGLETLTVSDITDITATASELNKLDGVTATKDELNLVDGSVTGPLSHRNMIINGAMQVSQRLANDTLVQVTNASYVSLDRWKTWENTGGTYQVKQKNITDLDGFTSSLYLSPNAVDTSVATSEYALVGTTIEAQNLQHIGVGTANAKTMTLSFYIKSSWSQAHQSGAGGKMNAYLAKYDNGTMVVPLEFDLPSSAGTWERKTLTVPAVTTGGVINNDNGLGFEVIWALAVGSTYKIGTNGTWGSSGNGLSTSNHNINFMGSTSNYIELTGVQLELGSVATPFEHRSYGDELARCQRYFYRKISSGNNENYEWFYMLASSGANTLGRATVRYPVTMRSTPTISNIDPSSGSFSAIGSQFIGDQSMTIFINDVSAIQDLRGVDISAEL